MSCSTVGGLSPEQSRGRIPSLIMLAKLIWMQPKMWLPFWAVKLPDHVWFWILNFSSTNFTNPSLQDCSQLIIHPACICAWDCPKAGAGPCILFCWTSWGFTGPPLMPAKVLLDAIPSLLCVNCTGCRLIWSKLLPYTLICSAFFSLINLLLFACPQSNCVAQQSQHANSNDQIIKPR